MKKLDWYIAKKFLLTFFAFILLVVVIVIIFDISEKIDDFVKNHAPIKEIIFDYFLNFVPYFINMFSPLFVFISVIFFTSQLASNTEFIAMLSGGISYARILVPYLACAVLIGLVSLFLSLYVIPPANVGRVQFEVKYIHHHNKFKRKDIHYQIAPGQFVYVESYSAWNNTAYKFTLESIENNRIKSKLTADSAAWDSTTSSWRLKNWFIRDYTSGLQDHIRSGAQMDTTIALTVDDFYRNEKTVEALSQRQLNQLIETQKMRGDSNVMYAQIEKHNRFAMSFSAIILTIMGVCISSRKKRGATGWNIGIGIALAFSYILFMRFSQMFVYTGTLPAAVALWMPNFLYALIAVYLYKHAQK